MSGAANVLASLGLGLMVALGVGAPMAAADDEYGDDTVTITVTIDEFDPCAVGAAGCDDGGGDGGLAYTGAAIGVPLGAGILLTAVGAGVYALATQRRKRA
jgi:hypothetical protein